MKKLCIFLVALFMMNGAMGQWVPQISGTTEYLGSVFFTNANTGFAVGGEGTILKTMDGGSNWNIRNSGTSLDLICVHFPKPDTGYVLGFDYQTLHSIILKTTDGGENWTTQFDSLGLQSTCIYFTDANTGYITGDSSRILKTIDGGTTWMAKNVCENCIITSIHFPSVDIGYTTVTHMNNKRIAIFKTLNGGESWVESFSDTLFLWYERWVLSSIHFPDMNTGYAGGTYSNQGHGSSSARGICFKTSDAGSSWTRLDQNNGWEDSCPISSIYFTDPNTGYMVGTVYVTGPPPGYCEGGIHMTMDGGENLTTQYLGPMEDLNSIHFPSPDTGYVVGYFYDYQLQTGTGVILKTTNGGYPVGTSDISSKSKTLNIYPNPSSTVITVEMPNKGSLSILNIYGQELITRQITEPKMQLDISNLPSGVYFVKVMGERTMQVGKFVRQ